MRIGIDARMYGKQSRGIGRYVEELIKNLEQVDSENEYYIFLHSSNFNEYKPKKKNFNKILADFKRYSFAEQIFYPKLLKKYPLDLMHFPHFNVPLFYNRPFIVTIHDLIIIRATQKKATTLGPLFYRIKKIGYHLVINHAVAKAKKIIAVSKFTKNDILDFFKIPEHKVAVIYNGLSTFYDKNLNDKEIILGYNIIKPYLLYVGSAYPHKNLEFLLSAFAEISQEKDWDLVLCGQTDFFYKRLKNYAQKLNIADRVHFLGYVPDENLPSLYKNCLAYVFPSRYEGFGLPALEAMQYDALVISSKSSCLPEILGNAALYFDPKDKDELKRKIYIANKDQNLRKIFIQNDKKRTALFDWRKCSIETKAFYINYNAPK